MNDIDTIREALEEYAHRQWCAENGTAAKADSVLKSVDAALAALERVSALQAEMEAALESILNADGSDAKLPYLLYRKGMNALASAKESR